MIWFLAAALLVSAAGAAQAGVDDLPCVLCHPSRDRAAFEALSAMPGVEVKGESGQAFVCYSCHNGSVVDSRKVLAAPGQHPTGFTPRSPLPKGFPLYGGRVDCGTCHSPHGKGPGSERWLRAADDGSSTCQQCHPKKRDLHLGRRLSEAQREEIAALGGRPGPSGELACSTCHAAHGGRGTQLLVGAYGGNADKPLSPVLGSAARPPPGDELCGTCHRSQVGATKHAGRGCSACHAPHSDTPALLAGGKEGPCAGCHPGRAGKGEHQRLTPGCSGCHSVHGPAASGGEAKGLLRFPVRGGVLCASCHKGKEAPHGPSAAVAGVDTNLLATRGIALGSDGHIECTTCHKAHGASAERLLPLARPLLCLYCHGKQNPFGPGGAGTGRHPVGVSLNEEQARLLDRDRASPSGVLTCVSCHSAHGSSAQPQASCSGCHPNRAGGAGHGGVEGCGACHSVHGRLPPSRACAECHGQTGKPRHPPGAKPESNGFPLFDDAGNRSAWGAIACPTCHDVHSRSPALARGGRPADTCLTCHAEKRSLLGGPHDREAAGEGPGAACKTCHPAHAPIRKSDDPAGDSCRECHGKDLHSLAGHSPVGSPAWQSSGAEFPLFDRFGNSSRYGFITCPTCHDVHQAKGGLALRLESRNPPRLCLACHKDKANLLGSPHDPRGSGEGDACGLCHQIHSRGQALPLWGLRSDAQGSWNDRKCSSCHGPPATSSVPRVGPASHTVNIVLPAGMKPEGLALYDSLGGRPGRTLTCATCHDIHGAPAEAGGRISKFLRKDPGSGSLCTACHPEEGGIVSTPHDLREAQPSGLGPCGPCHSVHKARTERALWGLEPAPGEYVPNTRCRSCHRAGGPVARLSPLLQYHMKDAEPLRSPRGTIYLQRPMLLLDETALRTGGPPEIPLYDKVGTPGSEGNLQCVSCHDPHRWSAMAGFVKPNFGVGPNVPTRFLRLRDPRAVERSACGSCHREEAVDRYRRYHQVWEEVGGGFR